MMHNLGDRMVNLFPDTAMYSITRTLLNPG
jgi:hypothetical protein